MTAPLRVVFLTRQGRGLCDKALAALEVVGRDLPLDVVAVDIDADPALLREFDWRGAAVRVARPGACRGPLTPAGPSVGSSRPRPRALGAQSPTPGGRHAAA